MAGGRSSRMGFDKARAAWGRLPLALAAARSLVAVCDRVALIRRDDDGLPWRWEDDTEVEVVWEAADRDHHPLWGVVAALGAARSERVGILAGDVPGVGRVSWEKLASRAPAVAVDETGRVHPLIAVLDRGWLHRAETLARSGAPAHRLVDGCAKVIVPTSELADHDEPASLPDPFAELLARVPVSDPATRARVVAGEEGRLRSRGILIAKRG